MVVPTYRRPRLLSGCLDSLAEQDADPAVFEVIVVDDSSGDDTGRVVEKARHRIPGLRSVAQPRNRGPAAARNRGVAEARGSIVLFIDDDIVATPSLVATHLAIHRERADRLLGVLGLVRWAPWLRVTPFMRWVDRSGLQFGYDTWIREGEISPPYAAFYTCNLSMRRELFLAEGGFDERFPYPAYEDMELAWRLSRLGFRLEHHAAALAYHARPLDLPGFAARMGMVAESAVLLRAVQPEFPLDERDVTSGYLRRRKRWLLRLRAPLARLLGDHRTIERLYRAEIAAAYLAGRRRGLERLSAAADPAGDARAAPD